MGVEVHKLRSKRSSLRERNVLSAPRGSCVIAVILRGGVISLSVLYENAGKKGIVTSLSNYYVLELIIGKGALKDTFL